MNWDAIGAIGENIGAFAVVISIIYLAVQIRQNTKTVAANTAQAVTDSAVDALMRVAESHDLSSVAAKTFAGDKSLTGVEQMQLQLVLRSLFRNFENYFYQHRRGYFEEEIWAGYKLVIFDQLSTEAFRDWWDANSRLFGKSFVEFVNNEVLAGSPMQS